jgi:hypothetical protein
MLLDDSVTTAEVSAIFAEEISAAGGTVTDIFDDGSLLLARSVLPWIRQVRPRDQVQGGVALRVHGPDLSVHPYVFRQVCTNGAIMAQAIESQRIEGFNSLPRYEAEQAVRSAVRACAVEEAFSAAAGQMRSAIDVELDRALTMLPMLARLPEAMRSRFMGEIMSRFMRDGDRSQFGFMNAVTSLARDTRDPDTRWRLEEFGGGIVASLAPAPLPDGNAVEALVSV